MPGIDACSALPQLPEVPAELVRRVARDYERFAKSGLPQTVEPYLLDEFDLDVSAEYAGFPLKNPWGKASGQLSTTLRQVEDDVAAGLGFVVLKTVIAQDERGESSMSPWAVKAARMVVERITGRSGRRGWTVSWIGRGWWQSFGEYLTFVEQAANAARGSETLIVPSCKYHLPSSDAEQWNTAEYCHTTPRLLAAWQAGVGDTSATMPLEKDFSPTLAGSERSREQERILGWLRDVTGHIRQGAGEQADFVRVGLKLFNALFDDDFQVEMVRTVHASRPEFYVYGNRLFDPQREFDGHRGIAYGGPDLSDRNLRVMSRVRQLQQRGELPGEPLPWSATGNIDSGRTAVQYALCGASSFQLHTYFQLPAGEYRMPSGRKTDRALHELYFHPERGFIVWMHHVARQLKRQGDVVRFCDIVSSTQS